MRSKQQTIYLLQGKQRLVKEARSPCCLWVADSPLCWCFWKETECTCGSFFLSVQKRSLVWDLPVAN